MSDFLALTFGASTIQEVTLKGEPVAIRRATGPAGVNRPFTDTVTRAYVRDFEANELVGTITQGDRVAITLVDALADILPVLESDKLVTDFEVIDGIVLIDDDGHVVGGKASTIKKVKRRKVGGTLIALEIQAAG
jgi:hypothetical protein